MGIDQDYDQKLLQNLSRLLNREPLPHELANADNDAGLVDETMWQVICDLSARISDLEAEKKIKTDREVESITVSEAVVLTVQ